MSNDLISLSLLRHLMMDFGKDITRKRLNHLVEKGKVKGAFQLVEDKGSRFYLRAEDARNFIINYEPPKSGRPKKS